MTELGALLWEEHADHALGATSGLTYSQIGQYAASRTRRCSSRTSTEAPATRSTPRSTRNGKARLERCPQPVDNRDLTQSALNLAYTASQISLFGIVVGSPYCSAASVS